MPAYEEHTMSTPKKAKELKTSSKAKELIFNGLKTDLIHDKNDYNPDELRYATMSESHRSLKATQQRGSRTQSHLAAVRYLKKLENELDLVQKALREAWKDLDSVRHFHKCMIHMDSAQQRLHRAIKKITKLKEKKK